MVFTYYEAPQAAAVGMLVFLVATHIFVSYCLKRICEKVGEPPGPLIWIPIAQLAVLLRAANMSQAWLLLVALAALCVPFTFFYPSWFTFFILVLVIFNFLLWSKICTARGKSSAGLLLLLIPLAISFVSIKLPDWVAQGDVSLVSTIIALILSAHGAQLFLFAFLYVFIPYLAFSE